MRRRATERRRLLGDYPEPPSPRPVIVSYCDPSDPKCFLSFDAEGMPQYLYAGTDPAILAAQGTATQQAAIATGQAAEAAGSAVVSGLEALGPGMLKALEYVAIAAGVILVIAVLK